MKKNIPDRKECIMLLTENKAPENVYRHSLRVCQVALFIVQKLIKKGKKINFHEVRAGALLHDICKIQGINEKKDHALLGSMLLEQKGYYSIAEIVRQHVNLENPENLLSPAALVNYADKRVRHHEIVTLKVRFEDLVIRYGKTPDLRLKMRHLFLSTKEIEDYLFKIIEIPPDEVNTLNQFSPHIEDNFPF